MLVLFTVAGKHTIRLEVSNCPGYPIADLATGFFSTSRFIIQELPSAQSPLPPLIAISPITPPTTSPTNSPTDNYLPIWRHCVEPDLEEFIDNGTLNGTKCTFMKQYNDTVVKVTWDGSLRVVSCK